MATPPPVGLPTLFLNSPNGRETWQVAGGAAGPQQTTIQTVQLRDAAGYSKQVPVTGATFQCPDACSVIQATPAGALSAWTVLTPITPVDGQKLRIFTTQTITTFNLTASGTQTVNGNLAGALNANVGVEYLYSLSNTTWDRIL